jgi:hypothetical protein
MTPRLTPSLVISVIALFVALGGTGYAVSQLPANSVTTKQVKNRSLLAKDFKKGQIPKGPKGATGATGEKGATGATGDTGPDGSAKAYAYIEDLGANVNAVTEKSKGITSAMVSRPQTGVYCFELSSLGTISNAGATAETNFNDIPESDKVASLQLLNNSDFGFGCPPDSDMVVLIRDLSAAAPVNWFFYVTLN